MGHEQVVILDFGGQCTHLIARRVRQMHVYIEVRTGPKQRFAGNRWFFGVK